MKSSKPEFITIGTILASWGSTGQLKVGVATDFPERFAPLSKVYLNRKPVTVSSTIWRRGKAIVKFDSIDSPEDAEKLQGKLVEIHNNQVYALPEGQYYHFQLIGLEVWTTQGELLGYITEILPAASNDNYAVKGDKGVILIPAIEDVVKSIDLKQRRLLIEPIDGLLSLNEKAAN